MLILGIDTSTKVCTVGLCQDGIPLGEYEINMGMTHSEGLLPQLQQLFERTGIDKKALDLIGISIGPGSFTGLRIGLATAEAMAYSWQIPVCGVNTLEALAYNVPIEGLYLASVLDAQKGNYYSTFYQWQSGELLEIAPVEVVSKATLLEKAAALSQPVVILGECGKLEKETLPSNVTLAALQIRMPKATSVALLAEKIYDPLTNKDIFGLEPYYIRRSEAEELWEQRQGKK